jgi:hypothetical protein
MTRFAFCESVAATGASPWRIRELSERGLKLGGGADTLALCGRDLHGGWDLEVPITGHHLNQRCRGCAAEYGRRRIP